ncbi:MAG: OmpA family protein [Gammaproteobacteria bacterium]
MKVKANQKIASVVIGVTLLGLSGCTSIDPYTGQTRASDTTIGTGIGAVAGAGIGALIGGERGAYIGAGVGALGGGAIGYNMDKQNEELRQALVGSGVQVRKVGNTIQLIMASDVTFATNQAAIQDGFYPTLDSVAMVFKKYNQNTINITGYTDSTGNPSYNQQLSEQRAQSVGNYLISRGVSSNRVYTNGLGQRNPVASNATPSGRAMNRRVVIMLRPI